MIHDTKVNNHADGMIRNTNCLGVKQELEWKVFTNFGRRKVEDKSERKFCLRSKRSDLELPAQN
jgi:hypothetical protein